MRKVIRRIVARRGPRSRGTDSDKRLRAEVARLRARVIDAEETMRAIRAGEVDALVVQGQAGDQIFTLKGAERSYRLLVETMSEGAATFSEDGTILYCNGSFAKMVDRPLERTMGSSIHEFVSPQHREMFQSLVREGYTCGDTPPGARNEINFGSEPPRSVPAYVSLSPLFNDAGASVLCLVATDLSAQKRSEEMLSSEHFARSIIEQATDAMLVCDENGRIIRASRGVLGFSQQLPLFSRFCDAFPSDSLQSVLDAALHGERPLGVSASLALGSGRGVVEVLASGAPLLDLGGNAVGAIVTITDVTALKQAQKGLEVAVTIREEFLSIASHELRTPLTSLQLQLDSLCRTLKGDHDWQATIRRAESSVDSAMGQVKRLTHLVDALLDVSRLRTGRFELRPEEFDLASVTRVMVASWAEQAKRAGCALRFHESLPTVGCWDRLRIEQALTNLISNATKYGPGKPVDITIDRDADNAWITVEDRGMGIAADDQERIFRMFERAVPSQHYGGLGLGLFITLGKGSTFRICLPVAASGDRPEASVAQASLVGPS
jgi:PAS domain S-box-containing protein